jgi:charged multivesicular body protein 7
MERKELQQCVQSLGYTKSSDFDIIINHLIQKKIIQTKTHGNLEIIKWSVSEPIEQTDIGTIQLWETVRDVQKQIKELESRQLECVSKAKQNLLEKKKAQAKYHLKQKNQIQSVLEKRLASLDTLETMLLEIQNAENHLKVFYR